jgi:hypothetical protein
MRYTNLKYTGLVILAVLVLIFPGFAVSAEYYSLTATTIPAPWDGTIKDRLIAPTTPATEYNYAYGDEKSVSYALPWSMPFYGRTYTMITADTNGNIWFGTPNTAYAINLTSVTKPVLAAWNTDLDSSYTGGVFIQHKTAPERVVIEWQARPYFESAQLVPATTFEVVLFQTGAVRIDYGNLSATAVDAGSGISRGDGVGTRYMNATATFGAANLANNSYALAPLPVVALSLSVTGPGEVALSPGGVCSTSCSNGFPPDSVVQLTPNPSPNSRFTGWTGACTGTGACSVTMSAAKTVSAEFIGAPTVAISSPTGTIAAHRPVLTYSVGSGTVVVKVDGVTVNKISGDTLDVLSTGTHTVRVEATDTGLTGFTESSFTILGAQPLTIIGQGSGSAPVSVPAGEYSDITLTNSFVSFAGAVTADSVTMTSSYAAAGDFGIAGNAVLVDSELEASGVVTAQNVFASSYSWIVVDKPITVTQTLALSLSTSMAHHPAKPDTTFSLRVFAGTLSIDASSTIDVSGRGFLGGWRTTGQLSENFLTCFIEVHNCVSFIGPDTNDSLYGRTFGNALGSGASSGGSHGGVGVGGAVAYDDYQFPTAPGGGGGGSIYNYGTTNGCPDSAYTFGGNGGGVIRVTVAQLDLHGSISANGLISGGGGSGAGGSIWIEASSITGDGHINANGGNFTDSYGGVGAGGGRVAMYYSTNTLPLTNITVDGGLSFLSNSIGTDGTIYLKDLEESTPTPPASRVRFFSPVGVVTNTFTPVLSYLANATTIVVKVDGIVVNKVSGDTLDTLTSGNHLLRIEAYNAVGIVTVEEHSFEIDVDITPPILTLYPFPSIVKSPSVSFNVGIVDQNLSSFGTNVTVGTSNVSLVRVIAPNVYEVTVQNLSPGVNSIRLFAYDLTNNFSEILVSVTYAPPLTPTLSVSSVAANYIGSIGLTISDISPIGSPVLIEQFIDRKHDGTVSAGDYALRSFTITDGAVGDDDGTANGSITTSLDYRMIEDVYHAPGRYLFRATLGAESAVSSFAVTSVGQAQSISGLVSDGINPVPGALIQLTDKWNRHVVWTTADELGSYYVDVKQPGSYQLMAYAPGFVDSTTPVTLAASQNLVNTTLVLNTGTNAVTGTVVNTATSAGISGIWVQAKNGASTAVAITDVSGNYNFTLPAGTYSVTALAGDHVPGTSARGYVGYDNLPATVTVAGATVVPTLPLTAGTIQFTGIIKDSTSTPVPGVPVRAKIKNSVDVREPVSYAVSKVDGSYSLGVFAGTAWDITLDNAVAQTLGYLGTSKLNLSTVTSPRTGNDITVKPITAWFQGTVTDSTPAALANVEVTLRNVDSSVTASVFTAADGSYRIGAYAGTWYLDVLSGTIAEQTVPVVNGQTATVDFVKDVTPPTIVITSPAAGLTNDNTPLLTFTVNEGTPVVKVDGVTVTTVSGSSLAALANGSHTIRVESTDASGNLGFAQVSITVNWTTLAVSTASLPSGSQTVAYNQTLTASGGVPPYAWSFTGALPAGLTMTPGGVISGTPTSSGTSSFTVSVSDSNPTPATKALSIVVAAAPTITTASLPNGTTGVAYSQALAATGGTSPYVWTLQSGSTLPSGLTITSGVISGTPTLAGTYNFTIVATDTKTAVATKALSITVVDPLLIFTPSLVDGYLSTAYNQTLTATGGTTYSWGLNTGSTMPAGLILSTGGVITGTPTTAGTTSVTFKVTSGASSATKALTIVVYALPAVSTATLPAGTTGTAYNQTLAATGGKATLVWTSTALPTGLTMTNAGVISGTPTTAGTTSVTFTVTDANNKVGTKAISMTVAVPAISVLNAWASLPAVTATTTTGTISAGSVTASAGTNRLMLVAVTMKTGSAAAPTINVTLGGTTLLLAKKTTTSQTESVWVGYALDSVIGTGAKAISVSYSGATGNALSTHVKWAVFQKVNQTTPVASSAAAGTTATSATFGTAVNYVVGGITTVVAANSGTSATGAITATTPAFSTVGTVVKSASSSNTFTTAVHTAAGSYAATTAVTWTGTTANGSATVAVSLQP